MLLLSLLLSFRESRSAGPAGELLRAREQKLVDAAVAYTETAMARGLIEVENPRLTVLVILGACERLFFEVLSGTELGDVEQISRTVVGLFEQALSPGASPE